MCSSQRYNRNRKHVNMGKNIYLTESQFKDYLRYSILLENSYDEGVRYKTNTDGTKTAYFDPYYNNSSNNYADTKIFKDGTKEFKAILRKLPKTGVLSVNLYDLRGDRNISKTWKHSMDKDKNPVIQDKSMDILFNRSIIYATSLIRKYLPDVDYILIPQSSSDFNKRVGEAISEHLGSGSDYTYFKPDIFVKSVKDIEIDYDWINRNADNIDKLTPSELEALKRRIFKWINVDEQIRTLYGDIKKLNDEINSIIALKSEKRGRPTKFVSDRKNAIKDKQQQIDTILQHNIGRPIQYVDDEGNVKSWEIKHLEGRLRKAIKGFMQLNPKYNNYTNKFKGKKIVIFDDNISSGATMDDCCLCLQKIGVNLNDILVLTFGVMQPTVYSRGKRG